MTDPVRGEIWVVRFDPSEGDEIKKTRPAVVMTAEGAGRMRLHIVVPITGWQDHFDESYWITPLLPDESNGLTKKSAADAFQVKSISVNRFERKAGVLSVSEVEEIAAAIALCVGYSPEA
jgi:mRNA interferase MazF